MFAKNFIMLIYFLILIQKNENQQYEKIKHKHYPNEQIEEKRV